MLESGVFPKSHESLREAIRAAGHVLLDWDDRWWSDGFPAGIGNGPTVFHGSLGNAARIAAELKWSPGSFCDLESFRCSAWYPQARPWLIHAKWRILPAAEFVARALDVSRDLGGDTRVFVRPDSPLKPFSGRVVDAQSVTLKSLDYGFYFEDESLPVVVAPVRSIGREWRFLVVKQQIVTGSEYDAASRSALTNSSLNEARLFAQSIASSLPPTDDAYVLDVCESGGQLRLMELNPFGGADLYGCDAKTVVDAVASLV